MHQGPFTAFRLPPGRHGLSREQVRQNQRWRLLGATAEVVAERGYLHTTTADIARGAGVSRTTFYLHFEGLPACLLATYEMVADCVVEVVVNSCESEQEREERLEAAVDTVLKFLVSEPALARMLSDELAAGVPAIALARTRLIEQLCPLLKAARRDASTALAGIAEPHLVAGALSVVAGRVADDATESLPSLAPALVEILSTPYRPIAAAG